MKITDLASIEEKVAYINGFLSAIQTLNTTSNNIMDHSFTLVKLIDSNLEKSLQKELNASNTSFSFNIINDWARTFEIDNTYFFSNVISVIKGDDNIDAASFSKLLDRFNLKD